MKSKKVEDEFELLITVQQAASLLGVHWQTVLKYIKTGQLEAVYMGNRYRIMHSSYEKFIAGRINRPIEAIWMEVRHAIEIEEL